MLAGDRDRERAAAALREHYARGRLTLEELTQRVGRVVSARSQAEIRRAMSELPLGAFVVAPALADAQDLVARGRTVARAAVRGLVLLVWTCAYLVFSFALLIALAVTLLVHGASTSELIGFLVVWLVPTYMLVRLWRRRPPRRLRA